MTNIIKRIRIKYVKWYFVLAITYGMGFYIWGMFNNRADYLMGIFGATFLVILYNHLGEKQPKFSELETMGLICFGLTTILISFIT